MDVWIKWMGPWLKEYLHVRCTFAYAVTTRKLGHHDTLDRHPSPYPEGRSLLPKQG